MADIYGLTGENLYSIIGKEPYRSQIANSTANWAGPLTFYRKFLTNSKQKTTLASR